MTILASRLAVAAFVWATAAGTAAGQATKLGTVVFPTSGSPGAQESFLRGVAWLHSFGYDEAMDAFREAERLDPNFAMAYWGDAMSQNQTVWHTQDVAAARRALTALGNTPAARAAKAPTPKEKAYLAAVEQLFGQGDKRARDRAYADAMRRLSETYPDDDEAATFHALALMGTIPQGEQDVAIRERAGAIAERVFARNPKHPGAAHLVIHAYDDREHAPRALAAARTYAAIAPDASHALHMPAHIFLQLGLWDDAVRSDEASFASSDGWVKRRGFPLSARDYHSLSWLQYEYLQRGQYRKAKEALKPLEEAITENGDAAISRQSSHLGWEGAQEGHAVRLLASMRARYIIETRQWSDVRGQRTFDNLDELFAVGMASAILSDFTRADETVALLRKQVAAEPNPLERRLALVMQKEMEGLVSLARSRTEEGLAHLREANAIEDSLPGPIGRPYPVKESHELLGEILLGMGRSQQAIGEFDRALTRSANRALSLLGLARATRQLGDHARARELYAKFLTQWHAADPERAELVEARSVAGTAPASTPVSDASSPPTAARMRPLILAGLLVIALVAAMAWSRRRRPSGRAVAPPKTSQPSSATRRRRR